MLAYAQYLQNNPPREETFPPQKFQSDLKSARVYMQ